jgi:hypothetical protein
MTAADDLAFVLFMFGALLLASMLHVIVDAVLPLFASSRVLARRLRRRSRRQQRRRRRQAQRSRRIMRAARSRPVWTKR